MQAEAANRRAFTNNLRLPMHCRESSFQTKRRRAQPLGSTELPTNFDLLSRLRSKSNQFNNVGLGFHKSGSFRES